MRKKLSLLLVIVLLLPVFTACSKSDSTKQPEDTPPASSSSASDKIEPITIKAGTPAPSAATHSVGLEYMNKLLQEYSDGAITIDIYPDAQLGTEHELVEMVGFGTVDMAVVVTAPLANCASDFITLDLPYLVKDREKAVQMLNGDIGRVLFKKLEPSGIYGLAYWEQGFRQIANNKKPIKSPSDMKNIKLRTVENDLFEILFTTLGAYPTAMANSEVFTALEQGVIDCVDYTLTALYTSKTYEVVDYLTISNHVFSSLVPIINLDLWNSFTPEVREMIDKAAKETAEYIQQDVMKSETKYIDELKAAGLQIEYVDMDEWAKACEPVYEKYGDKLDQSFVSALRGD